jgi:hypothetical protein
VRRHGADGGIGVVTLVERTLERDHVEAQFLAQELDQPGFGPVRFGHTMRCFSQLDDALAIQQGLEELQVAEVVAEQGPDRAAAGQHVSFDGGPCRTGDRTVQCDGSGGAFKPFVQAL